VVSDHTGYGLVEGLSLTAGTGVCAAAAAGVDDGLAMTPAPRIVAKDELPWSTPLQPSETFVTSGKFWLQVRSRFRDHMESRPMPRALA
jgi:hypothetical protein